MKKNYLFPLLLLVFAQSLLGQGKKQPVASTIENVTVFLNGGQVTRTAKTNLPAGRTELVFKDISPNIDRQSIQVKGDGAFTILSVIHQLNHLEEQVRREEITVLENEKSQQLEARNVQQSMLAVQQQVKAMLEKNQSVGGANTGVSTAELRQAVEYQRQQLTDVLLKQLETSKNIARIDSTVQKISKQLTALHQRKDLATSEVLVTVSAKAATSASFDLSYFVKDAGWFASYDLRVKDVSSPIDLSLKANVFQSSGEDWKEVKLTLSNGDPTLSGVARELPPWYLRYGYVGPTASQAIKGIGGIAEVSGVVVDQSGEPLIGATVLLKGSSIGTITDMDGKYLLKIPPAPSTLMVSYLGYGSREIPVNSKLQNVVLVDASIALDEVLVTKSEESNIRGSRADATNYYIDGVRVTGNLPPKQTIALDNKELYQPTTVNFEIEVPYTILNDSKTYSVDIKSETIPAAYEYFATPKLDENAYLTAHITDWQNLNLLDGEVNLFFEGGYLGKSLLDTRNSSDTLDISLGMDKGIVVKRTRLKDFSSRQFIGSNKTDSRAFEITAKNNKQQPINLTIIDQFPIPTDREMSVEDLEYEGATLDKDTQKLTWKLALAPRDERKVELRYAVKYPKKRTLVLE
ncbi:MAG: mucoidy inhibitor MuiA family protein [Saprospiraceae bacterium]|nr:mucoidy inhibitor MuiA family protein [Saprospiraceae bacterium]